MKNLNFDTVGNSANPSILCLHGFMSCNAQWLANQDFLAEHFHLVLVELWGHGQSPEGDDDQYTIDGYIEQFEKIREQLDIETWGAIGQSYGAGIVLRYAMRSPGCQAVLVTNSRSAFGIVESRARNGASNGNKPTSPRDLPLHPINARRFPPDVKAALVEAADAMTMSAINKSGRLAPSLNFVEYLDRLKQPVMLTNGRFEKSFQQDLAGLKKRHPGLNVVDLDGGHSVNIEAATEFNQHAFAFFTAHLSLS